MCNTQEVIKLDSKSRKCIFLGYVKGMKRYCLLDLTTHKVVISKEDRDVSSTVYIFSEKFNVCHDIYKTNIIQVMRIVSQYLVNPGKEHWNIIKRILIYIKGTSDLALYYGGSELTVRGYVDSDFTSDLEKKKSISGYVIITEKL